MTPKPQRPRGQSLAIVGFGPSSIKYLRPLRPGYRHCVAVLVDGGQWFLFDPLSNRTEITYLGELHPDEVMTMLRGCGYEAVAYQRRPPVRRETPWAPFTCVEAVKRTLGIQARWVLTPWQLRRYLHYFQGFS